MPDIFTLPRQREDGMSLRERLFFITPRYFAICLMSFSPIADATALLP